METQTESRSTAPQDETGDAALLAKKAPIGIRLLDMDDQVSRMRRELAAITETLKVFGVFEPEPPKLPAKAAKRRSREGREGFRRGELCCRVLEKIRESKEPAAPSDIGRTIMRECLLDVGDEKLYFTFQHKVMNVIRRQWQRGVLKRVGGDDNYPFRWKIANP